MSKKVSQSSHAESGLPDVAQVDACHGELDDPVLGQEAPDQWCMFLAYVVVIVFLSHARLTISANRPLKQTRGVLV